jgi:hypothetical protein
MDASCGKDLSSLRSIECALMSEEIFIKDFVFAFNFDLKKTGLKLFRNHSDKKLGSILNLKTIAGT